MLVLSISLNQHKYSRQDQAQFTVFEGCQGGLGLEIVLLPCSLTNLKTHMYLNGSGQVM
jgi:hypothetical protein